MLVLRNKMLSPTLQESTRFGKELMSAASKTLQERSHKSLPSVTKMVPIDKSVVKATQSKKLPKIDKMALMAKGGAKAQYQRAELPANWKPLRPVGRPAAPGMPQSSMAPRPVRF